MASALGLDKTEIEGRPMYVSQFKEKGRPVSSLGDKVTMCFCFDFARTTLLLQFHYSQYSSLSRLLVHLCYSVCASHILYSP